jgi:hypothetical protein
MGLLLTIAKRYVPLPVQKYELERLFKATIEAFECAAPTMRGLNYIKRLELYARFTREEAEKTLRAGRAAEVRSRLFENARRIGQYYQKAFRTNSMEEVMQAGGLIYRQLEIDFQGEAGGQIIIKRCFFSSYYSTRVCHLVSALDEGLLAGLSGGRRLSFSQRISEGHSTCQAYLQKAGRLS